MFKSLGIPALQQMLAWFQANAARSKGDDFYAVALKASRDGVETFNAVGLGRVTREAFEKQAQPHVADLGAVRLRHSSASQLLVPDEIQMTLPFDKNELVVEHIWNYTLQLEELCRQQQPPRQRINDIFRSIVHWLRLNQRTPDASQLSFLTWMVNSAKGRNLLSRLLGQMPRSYLKRFFALFTVIMPSVEPGPEFQTVVYSSLLSFLMGGVKASFVLKCIGAGIAPFIASEFSMAWLAALVEVGMDIADDGLKAALTRLAEQLAAALPTARGGAFLRYVALRMWDLTPKIAAALK